MTLKIERTFSSGTVIYFFDVLDQKTIEHVIKYFLHRNILMLHSKRKPTDYKDIIWQIILYKIRHNCLLSETFFNKWVDFYNESHCHFLLQTEFSHLQDGQTDSGNYKTIQNEMKSKNWLVITGDHKHNWKSKK